MIRMYVLSETVMIERPRKMVDRMRIARGRPSGVIVLAFGSTVDTGIDMLSSSKMRTVRRRWAPQRILRNYPGSLVFYYNPVVGQQRRSTVRYQDRDVQANDSSRARSRSRDVRSILETAATIIQAWHRREISGPSPLETNDPAVFERAKKQNEGPCYIPHSLLRLTLLGPIGFTNRHPTAALRPFTAASRAALAQARTQLA
jgi:hypothetical protein